MERIDGSIRRVAVSGVCSNCSSLQICHSCAAMAQTETGTFPESRLIYARQVREMKRLAEEQLATDINRI